MDIRWNLSGAEIERESFRTIESECDLREKLPEPEWRVARRLIHTTADMHIADTLTFRNDAIASGLAALRARAPLFCDSKMLRSGLSLARLRALHPGYGPAHLHCYIDDPDVAARAKAEGRTRALCSAEKARPLLDGAIVLIGNAPLALARIARYILEESAPRPGDRNARGVRQCRGVQTTARPLPRPAHCSGRTARRQPAGRRHPACRYGERLKFLDAFPDAVQRFFLRRVYRSRSR